MRLMNRVFLDLMDRCVVFYVDDILIYSDNYSQHLLDPSRLRTPRRTSLTCQADEVRFCCFGARILRHECINRWILHPRSTDLCCM